jgi:hypothetical protein
MMAGGRPAKPENNCPFCGREAVDVEPVYDLGVTASGWISTHSWSSAFVYCNACGARGPQKDSVEEAWAAWKGRVTAASS